MLFVTMLLMCPLTVSDGLLQDQGRAAQVAPAQSDEPRTASPAARSGRGRRAPSPATLGDVRIFPLRHAVAEDVVPILSKLLNEHRVYADLRTNSVIFVGSKEHAAIIESLLATLDTPPNEALAESELSIVPVRHRDTRSLAKGIETALGDGDVFGGGHLSIAEDRVRSMILLNGQREAVLKAKSIIKELDTPAATAQLEFSFFKARLHGDGAVPKIPEDLQPVAEELRRFGQVDLLGRLSTIATEQENFHIEGMIAGMISAEVGGILLSVGEDDSVKIKLDTRMALRAQGQSSKPGGPKPRFHLKTVVQARRGEFIVLGSAPNGWESGESAILVLHVPR